MVTLCGISAQGSWSNQILSGSDNDRSPVVALNWKYSIGQCIYSADEINLPESKLSGIAFCLSSNKAQPDTSTYEIWLGMTTKTTFNDRTDFVPESLLTKVFDGKVVHPYAINTWNYITFNTPFYYDGTSNLVLYMVNKTGDLPNEYPYYYNDESVSNSHIIAYSDNAMFRPQTMTNQIGSINPNRPWIKLCYDIIYGITIGSTRVTSSNASNITDPSISSGSASFDAATNTLTLDNLILEGLNSFDAISFDRGDLTINIVGNCSMYHFYASTHVNTTITGDNSASLSVSDLLLACDSDILTLEIDNINVNVHEPDDSYNYGIYGFDDGNLVFNNCHVEVSANKCSVHNFLEITLIDCHIEYPVGAVVWSGGGCIRLNGSEVDTVCIERDGTALELIHTNEFSVIPNPATDIVTLNDVTLSSEGYLTLTDAAGRTVAAVRLPANETDYTMDVATLPAGIYYINISSGTTRYTSTLIKK